jgi:hypothetical protein
MKKLATFLLMLLPVAAMANENETNVDLTNVEKTDSIESVVENILDKKFNTTFNVDFCTSLNGYFTENEFDGASLKLNRLRLDLKGKISDQFSFRVRQSFNKSFDKHSVENAPAALEYANFQWHPSQKFKLTVGKQFITIAGYEALANSMYVREFSDFNDNISFYRLGVTGALKLDQERNHELQLQVANCSESIDVKMPFITSVCWNGYLADRAVNLVYAASVAPITKGKNLYYLSCGNIYEKGPIFAYLDVMYSREEMDIQQRITSLQGNPSLRAENVQYLSFIAKFEYFFNSKWNAYVKGAYETSNIYADNGIFLAGRYMTNWNGQFSIEWKPFEKDKGFKLFAHYLYKGYKLEGPAENMMAVRPDIQRVSIGAIYAIPVL